jgi:hypothetical protein
MTKPHKPRDKTPGNDADLLPDDDVWSALESAAGELLGGAGGSVRIERLRPGGKFEYVDEWSLEGFTLGELQKTFGGGEYLLRLRDNDKKYFKQGRVLIAELPASKKDPAALAAADPIVAALTKQSELLTQLLTKLSAPPTEDLRKGLLSDLVAFKQILGDGGGGGKNDFKGALDMVNAAMEFSKKLGGGGGETTFYDVLQEFVAQAGGPVARAVESAVIAAQAKNGERVPALPVAVVQSQPEGATMQKIPPRYVALLVEKAIEGSDPALYADLIIDNVPEVLIVSVLDGGIVTVLGAIDARVPAQAQWFEQLGAVLRQALSETHAPPSG